MDSTGPGHMRVTERRVTRFFLISGFLLWLAATLAMRLFGQFFLSPENTPTTTALFLLTIPLVAAIAYPLYSYKKVVGTRQLLAAVCLALPGMVLDVLSMSFLGSLFPNLSPDAANFFGAWLLWAYFLILLTGLFPIRSRKR